MQQRKGPDYLKKLDAVVSDIQNRIKLTESFLENDSGEMGEEMAGNLRSSVGKANLLITQKLNQFRGLCHKNMVSFCLEFYTLLSICLRLAGSRFQSLA